MRDSEGRFEEEEDGKNMRGKCEEGPTSRCRRARGDGVVKTVVGKGKKICCKYNDELKKREDNCYDGMRWDGKERLYQAGNPIPALPHFCKMF